MTVLSPFDGGRLAPSRCALDTLQAYLGNAKDKIEGTAGLRSLFEASNFDENYGMASALADARRPDPGRASKSGGSHARERLQDRRARRNEQ